MLSLSPSKMKHVFRGSISFSCIEPKRGSIRSTACFKCDWCWTYSIVHSKLWLFPNHALSVSSELILGNNLILWKQNVVIFPVHQDSNFRCKFFTSIYLCISIVLHFLSLFLFNFTFIFEILLHNLCVIFVLFPKYFLSILVLFLKNILFRRKSKFVRF